MMNMRFWGILFLAGAAAFLVAGIVVPGVLIVFVASAIVFALVGALFLWMHTFMKDVPKVTMRSGLERMAAGTAFAAQTLQDMTGQGVGGARGGIDPRPGTSVVVAATDTGAPPSAADSAASASGRRDANFGRLACTCTETLPTCQPAWPSSASVRVRKAPAWAPAYSG